MPRGRPPIQVIDGKLPCSRCKELQLVDQFYAGWRGASKSIRACGYTSLCKKCTRQYFKDRPDKQAKQSVQAYAWQKAHPEQWHAIQVRYWAKCKLKRQQAKAARNALQPGDSLEQQSGVEII